VAQGLQDRPFPLGPLSKVRTTRGSHCYGATRYMPRDVPLQTADSKGTALVVPPNPRRVTAAPRGYALTAPLQFTQLQYNVYAATSGTPPKASDDSILGGSTIQADLKIFATYSTHLGSCMFLFFEKRQATHPQLSPLLRTAVNN
jgi:hypothetical protein